MTNPFATGPVTASISATTAPAITATAIAAVVSAHDEAGVPAAVARAPFRPATNLGAEGNHARNNSKKSDPDKYVVQVLASSPIDRFQGIQR